MLEQHATILVQFFQHAHHRAEGFLMDFQEELEQGKVEGALLERAAQSVRQHMYVEEELLFPLVESTLAEPIADLRDDHGRITDLMAAVEALAREGAAASRLGEETARLTSVLAAHSAKEDMGVYPDIVARLGPARTQAVLGESDGIEPPAGWACARRRARG
jgi:hemerythrin-like domain-containing protein